MILKLAEAKKFYRQIGDPDGGNSCVAVDNGSAWMFLFFVS